MPAGIKFINSIKISTLIIFLLQTVECYSTPEFALLTGNKCSKCHVNYQGSGMRTDFGWKFGRDATYFNLSDEGTKEIYDYLDKEKWSYFDGLLAFGLDARFQTARSHKTETAIRRVFPMQASFYLYSKPFEGLALEGDFNGGPKIFPGQRMWSASAYINVAKELPVLRFGYFQPSIGYKICDMTAFDRRIAGVAGTETLISPYYAEAGGELIYESIDWLTINAGIFDASSLSELSLFGQDSLFDVRKRPSFNFRLIFWPEQLLEDFPSTMAGASAYINGDFSIYNLFIEYSIFQDLFIAAQYVHSGMGGLRASNNYIGTIAYTPLNGVYLGFRAEYGKTELTPSAQSYIPFDATQMVLYAKLLVFPYFELMPEYRYLSTQDFKSTRWALQAHIYY